MMKYRNLTSEEIKKLEAAGCVARNWSDVLTSASSLDPARIRGVNFIGPVRMGTFDKEFSLPLPSSKACCKSCSQCSSRH